MLPSASTSKIVFVIWIVSISGFRQSTPHRSTISNFNSFQFHSIPSKSRIIQKVRRLVSLGTVVTGVVVVLLLLRVVRSERRTIRWRFVFVVRCIFLHQFVFLNNFVIVIL